MARSHVLFSLLLSPSFMLIGCQPPALVAITSRPLGISFEAALLKVPDTFYPTPSAEDKARAAALRAEGIALRNQGQREAAIATLQESVTLDSEALDGYVILGWTQHLAAQREAAAATLLKALNRDANHVPALNALGIVYLVDGQLEAAVETHQQAQTLTPDNEIAAYNLSLAYQRLQTLDQAIEQATRATQLEPNNPHPWVALAIAYYSNNNIDQARQAYGQALRLDGRYGDRSFLSHLEQAGFSPEQIELTYEVAGL
ncbi:MAG: tetratricopeptide repeat protein [Cyanobacteria bacterium J06639_16]